MPEKKNINTNNIVNQYITTIVQIFESVRATYQTNNDIISQTDGELNDIEHEVELADPRNARDGYKLYKEMRDLRVKRRVAKDENTLLDELYKFFTNNNNFFNALKQIQGNAQKVFNAQQIRTYTPRRRDDLTITDKTCKTNLPFQDALKDFKQIKSNGKIRKAN